MAFPNLLKTLLAISAIFFLRLQMSSCKTTRTKTLILGAGPAGVGFGSTLLKNGNKDFLILEANSYVGGRLRDVKLGNLTIQPGAGWIHDIGSHNPFSALKTKFGLKVMADDQTDTIVRDLKGAEVPGAKAMFTKFRSQIIKKFDDVNEKMLKKKEYDIPVKTALQIAGWNPKTPLEKVIDYYMSDFENANPPSLLSARQIGFTGAGSDEVVTDQRGYAHIIRELAKKFTSKIILNTTVTSINYTTTSVHVTTSTGDVYIADHAYVTFSTGVLSSSNVRFNPPLPAWKMKSIYMLPMGYYTKIFAKFQTKFWDNNRYILLANENRGHYVHYQNLDRAGLFPGEKMMVVTVTGDESKRVEKLTDAQVKAEIVAMLKKVYTNATSITDIFVSRWSQDPTTFGAYSSPVIGVDDKTYQDLKAPVNKTLWFGGEAATDSDHFGYAHAAYGFANKQAVQFMACLKDSSKCPVYKARTAATTPKKPKAAAFRPIAFNISMLLPLIVYFLSF